jgi:hypothetical protein
MDHNMALSYDYVKQKKAATTNECTSIAGHFDGHAEALKQSMRHCPMEDVQGHIRATRRCHRATTRSVSLPQTPGRQSTTQQWLNTPTLRAVSMAIAMRRYDTARIARWRGSRASLEATGCHHWASTCSDSMQLDIPTPVLSDVFHCQIVEKATKPQGWPQITIGVWHIKMTKSTWLV